MKETKHLKFLLISHNELTKPIGGAAEYIRELAQSISKRYKIDVVSWGDEQPYESENGNLRLFHFYYHNRASDIRKKVKHSFIREIFSVLGFDYYLTLLSKKPRLKLPKNKLFYSYDIIIVISFESIKFVRKFIEQKDEIVIEMPLAFGLPWYLPNLETWFSFLNKKNIYGTRFFSFLIWISNYVLVRLEKWKFSSNNIIAVSKVDANLIEAHLHRKIYQLFPVVPGQLNSIQTHGDKLPNSALFYSTSGAFAQISTDYIIKIAKETKNVSFFIAGSPPTDLQIHNIRDISNVRFLGWLEDVEFDNLLSVTKLVLFPSLQGSGVQTKLIRALSKGKAIIATSAITRPFEGLRNNYHLIIEDNPLDFQKKIGEIISDEANIEKLGYNAFQYYQKHFEKEVFETNLFNIINEILMQ